ERPQLVHHGVDGFLELQNLAAHVDGDLFREVAACHGDNDLGDVADLGREVVGHQVDVLRKVFPDAAHLANLRLSSELPVGSHLAGHAGDFGRKHDELLNHRVHNG